MPSTRLPEPGMGEARCSVPCWFNLDASGLSLDKAHAFGNVVDHDSNRHPLGKAHPGEDRIYLRQTGLICLRIRDRNAARHTANMSLQRLL